MVTIKSESNYKTIKSRLIFCITLVILSFSINGFMIYNYMTIIPLRDKELTTVVGTIESFENKSREYTIKIKDDNLYYSIITIYKTGFDKESFEEEVKVGDFIELLCSDYRNSQASVYSVKVYGKTYLSLDKSIDINEENNDIYSGIFIISAFSIYSICCCIYYSIKLYKYNKN